MNILSKFLAYLSLTFCDMEKNEKNIHKCVTFRLWTRMRESGKKKETNCNEETWFEYDFIAEKVGVIDIPQVNNVERVFWEKFDGL